MLFLSLFFVAQFSKAVTINVPYPGGLKEMSIDYSITDLTLTGKIDARDFEVLFVQLTKLTTLDLSDVNIMEYHVDETFVFPANTIPDNAFYSTYTSSGKPLLTKVILPANLTAVGVRSFENCTGLTEIILPEGVVSIGRSAFQNCTGLSSIVLPSKVTTVGNRAFEYCIKMTKVVLSKSLTTIGEYAFRDCEELIAVEAHNITPPDISKVKSVFENAHPKCVLYVLPSAKDSYRASYQWMDFQKIEELKL